MQHQVRVESNGTDKAPACLCMGVGRTQFKEKIENGLQIKGEFCVTHERR